MLKSVKLFMKYLTWRIFQTRALDYFPRPPKPWRSRKSMSQVMEERNPKNYVKSKSQLMHLVEGFLSHTLWHGGYAPFR